MSFQSMLESGECGATNPLLDLARQITTPSTLANSASGEPLSELNNQATSSQQANAAPRSFNMEALLEQMKLAEDQALKELEKDAVKPVDGKAPLIGNAPPSIEEDFWNDATRIGVDEELMAFRKTTNLPEYSNDWADEYFRQLPSESNSLFQMNSFDEALLESKESSREANDLSELRNQSVPLDGLQFGTTSSPFTSMPLNINIAQNISEQNGNDINLKDLVSDQEERLMQLLLNNNQSIEQAASETKAKDETEENVAAEKHAAKPEENFFYENQFDDMEFWTKLAEEWQSSKVDSESELNIVKAEETEKEVLIVEPLEKLLDENHEYHYTFIENNPFLRSSSDKESDENKVDKPNYIELGMKRLESGDIPAAVLLFEAATKSEPDNLDGWRLLGISQAKNENDHKAIAAMKRCLALDCTNLEALMYLATSLTNQTMPTEACHALLEWLKQHPKYSHLAQVKLNSFEGSSKYVGPTPLSRRWSTNNKDIFSNGFFDSVQKSFIDAALLSPESPDADVQCGLGVLFNISGDYEKAADCFKTAVSVRHSDHTLWNRLGASLANGGKSEEAMSAYREALIRYPGYIRARYNLAISCIILSAPREAVDHLLTVLNLQDAGPDSVRDTLDIGREHVTSSSVWGTLRSALMLLGRGDLFGAVDQRNLDELNQEFDFKLQTIDNEKTDQL